MKSNLKMLAACLATSTILFSCQKDNKVPPTPSIPQSVISQIQAAGYSTDEIRPADGGYVVEGDIFLSNDAIAHPNLGPDLRVAQAEQYHTTNLITGLPRNITVSISGLATVFVKATDSAIARYNAMGLRITFSRVASGGQIQIIGVDLGNTGILGQSSGFPTNGNPASPIKLNNHAGAFGSNPNVQWVATVIAHEMGHTIGFRHTDYHNRAYSCGGAKSNEGSAGVGAIWIPGTPTGPKDPKSWMLACTDGSNRPFNANDKIALNYLYH